MKKGLLYAALPQHTAVRLCLSVMSIIRRRRLRLCGFAA
jgi:hypothetical protein